MSMKRLAVIAAVSSHNSLSNQSISFFNTDTNQPPGFGKTSNNQGLQTMRPGANLHGNVNIMLGGAMLSLVITIVCFVCYCCHRNIKKRSASVYRQQWLDTDANMEIYSVEQCYDASGLFIEGTPDGLTLPNNVTGPPPSYDAVVAQDVAAASRQKGLENCPDYNSKYKMYDCKCDAGEDYTELIIDQDTNNYSNVKFTSADLMAIPWRFPVSSSGANDQNGNTSMVLCDCTIMDVGDAVQSRCRSCGQYLVKAFTTTNNRSSVGSNFANQCVYADCDNRNNNSNKHTRHLSTSDTVEAAAECIDSEVTADTNQNLPSTSSSYQTHLNLNNSNNNSNSNVNDKNEVTITTIDQNSNANNNGDASVTGSCGKSNKKSDNHCDDNMNAINLDEMNVIGLVRLDMSQIIDKTGLPTYEAALKLESSGYV